MIENKRHKQYAIVRFSPKEMTDKVIIQFYGGAFKYEEKKKYTEWLMSMHHQTIEEMQLDESWDSCQEVRKKDKYIDITTCSRKYYKYLQITGEVE